MQSRQAPYLSGYLGPEGTLPVGLLGALVALLFVHACQNRQTTQQANLAVPSASVGSPQPSDVEQVLLRGLFERVSKATSGQAEIVKHGSQYQLRLTNVRVASEGPVRVYLVGHDRASTTYLVETTELKYDMAELETGVPQQTIVLPSEPDPKLRSVVLYYPTFGVNLGFAPLRAAFVP